MSRPGASKILRKTSDSELGGIHFAHFPGDKGYYKNSSNVSLSGNIAWKSVGKRYVLITLFISSYCKSIDKAVLLKNVETANDFPKL